MNPITDLSSLNSISQSTNTYQFGSAAEALEAIESGEFHVLENPKSTTGNSNVVNFNEYVTKTEGLTGGSKVGSSTLSATTAEGVTLNAAGATVAVGAVEVIAGVAAGLGLGIISYEIAPEFWTNISNSIFGTEIKYDDLNDYSLIGLFKDDVVYFSLELINKIKNSLIDINAFKTEEVRNNPTTAGVYRLKSIPYGAKMVSDVLSNNSSIANKAVTKQALLNTSSAYSKLIENISIPYNVLVISSGNVSGGKITLQAAVYYSDEVVNNNVNVIVTNTNMLRLSAKPSDFTQGQQIRILLSLDSNNEIVYDVILNQIVTDINTNSIYLKVGGVESYGSSAETSSLCIDSEIIPEVPGIQIQENATIPSEETPIPIEYPDWSNRILEVGGIDKDSEEIVTIPYYPVTIPDDNPLEVPTNIPQTEAQEGTAPSKWSDEGVENIVAPTVKDSPTDPSSSNEGDTPIPVIPPVLSQGISGALFTVYHPTQEQLRSLANVLWSTDLITQIKSIFQNPMDGVISLMSLYATPTDGNTSNIILGTIDSGVSSAVVNEQYIDIDCGNVQIPEIYGDATDYSPYVNVTIFLPFIGMRSLNTNEIIASTVNVKYRIDVLTGTCLASVYVNKDNSNAILYTFEGNCGIELPLTGADRSRLLSGILSVAGGIAGYAVGSVGGAVAGVAVAGGAISASHVGVDRSGSFSGNGGAMGNKKPYIIVTRTIPYTASNYNNLYGYPSNLRTTLNSLSGYTRIKDVKTSDIPDATDEEKIMIERVLKEGVYI